MSLVSSIGSIPQKLSDTQAEASAILRTTSNCLNSNIIRPLVDRVLPFVASGAGATAGAFCPYLTTSFTLAQLLTDKALGANAAHQQWKPVCALTTASIFLGYSLFGPAFIGQSIIFSVIGSIFGGMQGLKAVGCEVPEDYVQTQLLRYAAIGIAALTFARSQISHPSEAADSEMVESQGQPKMDSASKGFSSLQTTLVAL
jgi:hypothetical protein